MVSLVCINGSPRRVSRTGALVDGLGCAIQARIASRRQDLAIADIGVAITSGLVRSALASAGQSICRMLEAADILVVASPVYRASYSGLLKHLFDLVDRDAMRGKVAVLAATGGTPLHGLMLEHQLRPLMGFFAIQTAATTVYGLEDEIGPDGRLNHSLAERVEQAADEVVALLAARRVPRAIRAAA